MAKTKLQKGTQEALRWYRACKVHVPTTGMGMEFFDALLCAEHEDPCECSVCLDRSYAPWVTQADVERMREDIKNWPKL